MTDFRKKAQGIDPSARARNVIDISRKTENIYHSLNVIAARADQISLQIKDELLSKLEEFAVSTENLEEIHENKEQIEISRYYERLPNAVLIALDEFMNDMLSNRLRTPEELAKKTASKRIN